MSVTFKVQKLALKDTANGSSSRQPNAPLTTCFGRKNFTRPTTFATIKSIVQLPPAMPPPLVLGPMQSISKLVPSVAIASGSTIAEKPVSKLEDCRALFSALFKIKDLALKDRIMKAINGVSPICCPNCGGDIGDAKTQRREFGTQTLSTDFTSLYVANKGTSFAHPDWDDNGRIIKRRMRRGPIAVQQTDKPMTIVTAKEVKKPTTIPPDFIKTVSSVRIIIAPELLLIIY